MWSICIQNKNQSNEKGGLLFGNPKLSSTMTIYEPQFRPEIILIILVARSRLLFDYFARKKSFVKSSKIDNLICLKLAIIPPAPLSGHANERYELASQTTADSEFNVLQVNKQICLKRCILSQKWFLEFSLKMCVLGGIQNSYLKQKKSVF